MPPKSGYFAPEGRANPKRSEQVLETIRLAQRSEAPRIRALITDAYAQARADLPDLPDVADGVEDEIMAGRLWVLERNGGLAGVLNATTHGSALQIINIAVDPKARGGGLGRALMTHAEALAAKAGVREMRLSTHVAMKGTRAFYARLGWKESGTTGNKVTLRKPVSGRAQFSIR